MALSARSAWYPYGGRIPNPLEMDGPDIGTVDLWQAESGKISRSFVGHDTPMIDCLKFLPDGKRLAALTYESAYALTASLIVWDVATGEVVARRAFRDHPNRMQFSKDGTRLVMWSHIPGLGADGQERYRISLWDVAQLLKSE